jgi:hypothetical protein
MSQWENSDRSRGMVTDGGVRALNICVVPVEATDLDRGYVIDQTTRRKGVDLPCVGSLPIVCSKTTETYTFPQYFICSMIQGFR